MVGCAIPLTDESGVEVFPSSFHGELYYLMFNKTVEADSVK
uniref:Uncharacterized protein n=1 Tax=Utricularia reniformis TaxID=192314 RepID=A0A1Y0B4Q6_9LAMI|nr:hypothetical protein AEK19_MT2247 [Utricularia reniformis]ART32392.1 hypothetical protein AEK19_MT2247 [Utricularia reniformis]